jgi:Bacterial pre-peptidase C-terminal domain
MTRFLQVTLALVSFASLPMAAQAQITEWRCMTDSLDASQTKARIEWARRCGLTTNTNGPTSWFNSGYFDQSFQPAKEYREINTSRAFTGNVNQYGVNYYYAWCLYETTPIFTVSQETSGPTAGYYKWSHNVLRVRPLYPVFENTPIAGGGTQLFPHPAQADCRLYTNPSGTTAYTGNFYVIAYCESSATLLTSGTPLGSLSGAAASSKSYYLSVPAGTRQVIFEISGGTGDADLYVKAGTWSALNSYACRPLRAGNTERCVVNNPVAGTWHATLRGWSAYSGVSITGHLVP